MTPDPPAAMILTAKQIISNQHAEGCKNHQKKTFGKNQGKKDPYSHPEQQKSQQSTHDALFPFFFYYMQKAAANVHSRQLFLQSSSAISAATASTAFSTVSSFSFSPSFLSIKRFRKSGTISRIFVSPS